MTCTRCDVMNIMWQKHLIEGRKTDWFHIIIIISDITADTNRATKTWVAYGDSHLASEKKKRQIQEEEKRRKKKKKKEGRCELKKDGEKATLGKVMGFTELEDIGSWTELNSTGRRTSFHRPLSLLRITEELHPVSTCVQAHLLRQARELFTQAPHCNVDRTLCPCCFGKQSSRAWVCEIENTSCCLHRLSKSSHLGESERSINWSVNPPTLEPSKRTLKDITIAWGTCMKVPSNKCQSVN